MSFNQLLGNEQLKRNLAGSIGGGHIAHFYLISGPRGSGKRTLARLLAAAILCRGERRPCMSCPACRKVMDGVHPDFITVDDPEKKTVPVDLIRNARTDMYIRPNEADHKIYLFPRAQDMGLPGQNALLKVLEEPPAYGVFILLTDNPNKLLPTVHSRCVELKLTALPEDQLRSILSRDYPEANEPTIAAAVARSGGFYGQAKELLEAGTIIAPQTRDFARALCEKNDFLLTQTLCPMERWKREALLSVLAEWLEMLQSALLCRYGVETISYFARALAERRSANDLRDAIACLQKAMTYAQSNVSPGAVCGYLLYKLCKQ